MNCAFAPQAAASLAIPCQTKHRREQIFDDTLPPQNQIRLRGHATSAALLRAALGMGLWSEARVLGEMTPTQHGPTTVMPSQVPPIADFRRH